MNINEIIERLEEMRDELGGEVHVRSVIQPNYPLLADLLTVTAVTEKEKTTVYIGIGEARQYGSDIHYADEIIHEEETDEEGDDQ
jgi:poly-beta-hydroxyalkanoate depolymerase